MPTSPCPLSSLHLGVHVSNCPVATASHKSDHHHLYTRSYQVSRSFLDAITWLTFPQMDQSSRDLDEDRDSLFGSPPPSPARGRSPFPETFVAGGETRPILAVPNAGAGRKNVGTIALPGSHMSCAELPANLLASRVSLPRPASHDTSSVAPSDIVGTPTSLHMPAMTSQSSSRLVSSRASSATSTVLSASSSTRRRRKSKSKSVTPILPPITLPGPNEPTPPNFFRSQSSLLGLAGLVGCVKPAHLHIHDPKPAPVQQPRSHTPIHGSTPTHPIVIDDDQDAHTLHMRKRSVGQLQIPQRLDQLDPTLFRSNITNTLSKEKNLFPVLESLIKLLGGEPHLPPANPQPQPFARPYGHGVFNTESSSIPPLPASGGSTTAIVPPQKRRKLKHVPAGAADWDVPFPFAVGEGPEAYHDTWMQDRAKRLVTQLLELVQDATKRAAIKTAKNRRPSPQNCQSSSETQKNGSSSAQMAVCESSSHTIPTVEVASLCHYLALLEAPGMDESLAVGSEDRISVDLEGAVEEGNSLVPNGDSVFEEWLSQLQQFLPPQTDTPAPEPDWGSRSSVSLDSGPTLDTDTVDPTQHTIRDDAIDPALLAISHLSRSALRSRSPTSPASTVAPCEVPQFLDIPPTPPPLAYSPRTSLSSLTEPLTPLSQAFADVPTGMVTCQDPMHGPSDPRCIPATQKGKAHAGCTVDSVTSSTSSRCTPKGALDKRGILERARERRRQLATEIERAKIEMWEAAIENAVLVYFTKDGS